MDRYTLWQQMRAFLLSHYNNIGLTVIVESNPGARKCRIDVSGTVLVLFYNDETAILQIPNDKHGYNKFSIQERCDVVIACNEIITWFIDRHVEIKPTPMMDITFKNLTVEQINYINQYLNE